MSDYVAGIDSSTQSCKVVIVDRASGRVVRSGQAGHRGGQEADPEMWLSALKAAARRAGGLDDVKAVSVAAQQHGMCALDSDGEMVRPALLWNDLRSSDAADELNRELGDGDDWRGRSAWAEAVGSSCFPSLTVAKLRWLRDHEPGSVERTDLVCLPHDWLTWRIAGHRSSRSGGDGLLSEVKSDRSDASGTGYWSPFREAYREDLATRALGRAVQLPRVLQPHDASGEMPDGRLLAAGLADNAATALAVQLQPGEALVSLGTSIVTSVVTNTPIVDPSGAVTTFCDAQASYLPMVATISGMQMVNAMARLLSVGLDEVNDLALRATHGAGGLVVVPYLEGEAVPSRPRATASVHGMTLRNTTPANMARAVFESLCCVVANSVEALEQHGVPINGVAVVGGGARSTAVRAIAADVLQRPTRFVGLDQAAAVGAARQAAWAYVQSAEPPEWTQESAWSMPSRRATGVIRGRYLEAESLTLARRLGNEHP